jgi:hypothetical protein
MMRPGTHMQSGAMAAGASVAWGAGADTRRMRLAVG